MTERLQDAFFRALFHSPVAGIAVIDLHELTIIDANDVMLQILGRARDQLLNIRDIWQEITPAEYADQNAQSLQQALERGYSDPLVKYYRRQDGSLVPVRTIFGKVPEYPDRLVVFAWDLSDEWKKREDAADREMRLNIAVSAANQGVWDYNLETGEMIYSVRAKEIYGLPVDQPVTFDQIRDATHPDDLPNTHAQLLRAIDPDIRDRGSYEYRIVRPDGTICWALAYGQALFAGEPGHERATRYIGTLQDITERKLAEGRQAMLVAELNHRVKNTLAIVQSFAHQSFTKDRSSDEARSAFEARLASLAATHDILTKQAWDEISLVELLKSSLSPHIDNGDRLRLEGPDLRVTPKTAVTLAMTMHELATNATKYGALSGDRGSVDLTWTYAEGELVLNWQERDGPRCATPKRTGFGTRMLRRALASEVGGEVELSYPESGFRLDLRAKVAEPL